MKLHSKFLPFTGEPTSRRQQLGSAQQRPTPRPGLFPASFKYITSVGASASAPPIGALCGGAPLPRVCGWCSEVTNTCGRAVLPSGCRPETFYFSSSSFQLRRSLSPFFASSSLYRPGIPIRSNRHRREERSTWLFAASKTPTAEVYMHFALPPEGNLRWARGRAIDPSRLPRSPPARALQFCMRDPTRRSIGRLQARYFHKSNSVKINMSC
ncbi:uncharacterized protein LOC127547192 [Antechinus flavipes]|uniref:uncharacterized protein LOC127547192 n=1 Tax=Antechinus flavipes TaxID=38775 RepID=UPI00223597E1|nr:uncharacterized protein LOC127547192 [Antechinus flavipes]